MSALEHPVSGPLRPLSMDEFLELFDPSVHDTILKYAGRYPDAEAVVCYENLDMWSSHKGHRTARVVGPSNSATLEKAATERLGDVPSQFQYPVSYCDLRK